MAMTLRLPDELDQAAKRCAESERLSLSALIIKATEEYVDRHSRGAEIDDAMAKIKARYSGVLDRLAQ